MGKIPVDLRRNVANNIKNCRRNRNPKWGGAKQCAVEFGVTPQQWSQWERGAHMPDEASMMELAEFFGVSTAFLRRENADSHYIAGAGGKETPKTPRKREGRGARRFESAAASKIINGIEVPLRVEVERVILQSRHFVRTEKIC